MDALYIINSLFVESTYILHKNRYVPVYIHIFLKEKPIMRNYALMERHFVFLI